MRIYSDADLNVLYIEGVSQGAVDSYKFTFGSDTVSALKPSGNYYDFIDLPWFTIQNRNGLSFDTFASLQDYLNRLIIPQFPLRFTVSYPLQITGDDVELNDQFINSLSQINGGFA